MQCSISSSSTIRRAWPRVRGIVCSMVFTMSCALAALFTGPCALAGPTGAQVSNGSATVTQAGATTTIVQSSQNLALQWNNFDTSAAESVHFVQPSRSALAVNRVVDTHPTRFFGKLDANGQVWLINPNGVLFGASAQVNVGGLVASTLDLDGPAGTGAGAAARFHGAGSGSIVNQGAIGTSPGGYVAFLGRRVDNHGSIVAPSGSVALAAGSDLTLAFANDRLLNVQVNQGTLDNLAENGGLIRADGGAVLLSAGAKDALLASAVNNTGIIEARSVRAENGTIVLDGGQNSTATNSGMLDASGRQAGATGGTVKLLGEAVGLGATSQIDVSGAAGGGTVLVGGNFLGSGPERHAQSTRMAAGAVVLADALDVGHGGRVALWSDGMTQVDGRMSARGGGAGGDGGQVETSGHVLKVGDAARVSTLAPRGKVGTWLLDPQDLTIGGFNPGDGDITGQQVTQALTTNDVTIRTGNTVSCTGMNVCSPGQSGNGDIILADGSLIGFTSSIEGNYVWSGNTTLTLSAYRNIELRGTANLDASGGTGNMVLRADNTGTGTGSVILGGSSGTYGNGVGFLRIYYNPTSYATPTDYGALMDSSNSYPLIQNANLSTFMLVNLSATVASKTYDGNTSATLTAPPTPRIALPAGVTVDTSNAVASFADKNAGINKATLVSGVALAGANASQYALNGLDAASATIDKASLQVTGVSASNKTYDASSAATLAGTAAVSAFGADAVNVAGSASAVFADKNAGIGKPVTVSGFTLAGTDAANYTILQPTGLSATIAPASLALTGVVAAAKTYDGNTSATLTGTPTVTGLGSDVVSVGATGTASFADKNAGAAKPVSVSGTTLTGADAGNYLVSEPTGLTATISRANLALTGIVALDKTYDASSAALLAGSASVSALGSDVVSVTGSGVGSFADKNAGAAKPVTVTGYALSGADAGNYNLTQPAGLSASIARASLALTGLTASNKTYDGTSAASLSGSAAVSALGADSVNLLGTGSASFADKNAGAGKTVLVSGYTLGGADAANYDLAQPTGLTADIARAGLAIAGVFAADKIYDGSNAATLGGSALVTAFGNDVVAVQGPGSAVFADKNAGANKTVSVSGFTLSGADAANYDVLQPIGLSATIARASLAIGGLGAADKVYDGTSSAPLNGSASVAPFGSDSVNLVGQGSAAFADKNAGTDKPVLVSGFALAGADADNYLLTQPAGLRASIAPASLALTGLTANNKTYDGSTVATLTDTASVSGLAGDVVGVTGNGNANGSGNANFADKNVGRDKAVSVSVSVSGYSLTGADAANYVLVQPDSLRAEIGQATLALTGIAAENKTYDGATGALLRGNASVEPFGSDAVTVLGTGSAAFADRNAGVDKAVLVSGFTLAGADAGNYALVLPTGLRADIARAPLAVRGIRASDKVYDGSSAATLAGTAEVTPFGADAVTLDGTALGAFADKNVGAAKPVLVSGLALAGADAGNYTIVAPAGLVAAITPAPLVVSGIRATDKRFDGSTVASVSTAAVNFVGKLGADSITVSSSGVFGDASAGVAKTVTLTNLYGGADVRNYAIVDQASTLASILPPEQGPPPLPPSPTSPTVPTVPTSPTVPTAPTVSTPPALQNAIVQVQSILPAPQARVQPQVLTLSSTFDEGAGAGVGPVSENQAQSPAPSSSPSSSTSPPRNQARSTLIDTRFGAGPGAPRLQIQDGGVQLPPLASTIAR